MIATALIIATLATPVSLPEQPAYMPRYTSDMHRQEQAMYLCVWDAGLKPISGQLEPQRERVEIQFGQITTLIIHFD